MGHTVYSALCSLSENVSTKLKQLWSVRKINTGVPLLSIINN